MLIFSQQDGRWASAIYNGHYSIGRYGCLITCVTMVDDWLFSANRDPLWVASMLAYSNGLLIWGSLAKIQMKLVQRVYVRNDAIISNALADPSTCVVLQVNSNHWVFAIGRKIPVLGYRIADPWDGRIKYTNAYRNNITGCAVLAKL